MYPEDEAEAKGRYILISNSYKFGRDRTANPVAVGLIVHYGHG